MKKRRIDTGKRNHNFVAMKKVTVALADDPARRVRIAAAKEDKSLSRFVADLLKERCYAETAEAEKLALLQKFLDGQGFPGVSKAWPGRKVLYAEREDELLRRRKSANLRDRRE
jgi:hypothetical protein